ALRIHFGDIVALVASHQDIPVGQPAGARWVRQLDLEQGLAVQVHGLDRLVVGNHEDLARWRHVNAADAAAHLEREGLDLLALGIQPDTDALGRETDDFALGDFEGGIHVPATLFKVVAKDLLAFAIQFQDLRLGGDERVAVAQALGVDRIGLRLILPEHFALQVAFRHGLGRPLDDEHTVAPQHAGVDGPGQLVDLPAWFA